ncbi:MAG: hypothetical protein IRZ21_00610 [Thermoleophilaceae bacterium]|nr:hypothetical protein [Thermoleophilaceae bacterium]
MIGLLRLASTLASAIVIVSFAAFASDQAAAVSKRQVRAIDAPAPSAAAEREREQEHGRVREAIDDANDVLVTPFTGLTGSSNVWVSRSVPAVAALLAYGVLARVLLAYLESAPSRTRARLRRRRA